LTKCTVEFNSAFLLLWWIFCCADEARGLHDESAEKRLQGVLYRSKLEARWAKFFDDNSIVHKYEFKKFDLGMRICLNLAGSRREFGRLPN